MFLVLTCLINVGSEKSALQALKASDWHLEAAFDVFYSQPQPRSNADVRRLEELYNRYKGKLTCLCCSFEFIICVTFWFNNVILHSADPYSDMILADGISVLCNDLEVFLSSSVMLRMIWFILYSINKNCREIFYPGGTPRHSDGMFILKLFTTTYNLY